MLEFIPGLSLMWLISFGPGLVVYGAFAAVSGIKKKKFRVIHWTDCVGALLTYPLWIAVDKLHWTLYGKSLSNLVELILIGWFWSLLFALRCLICFCRPETTARWLAVAANLLVAAATVLICVFFPSLPE